jgi:hypothetical protein
MAQQRRAQINATARKQHQRGMRRIKAAARGISSSAASKK